MRRLFLFIALFFPAVSFADTIHLQDLSGGMQSYPSPNKIADNAASYIQNFYTDIQPMGVERNGSLVLDSNLGSTSKPVNGLWRFLDRSGGEWLIEYSSRTYYKHLIGSTPVAFGPVATSTNTPRAAVNLGKIMFVNGVDPAWTFDGITTATVSGAPLGNLISPWRTRFVIANSTDAQSTIRFSADGDATSWTLGGLATDPFSIQIGGANDGQAIKCLGNYGDFLIPQRKYDTWAISGFDQSDVQNRQISSEVGCIEVGSAREFDGSYVFLSARGMEEMQGTVIKLVSEPIRNLIDPLIRNTNNLRTNTQTTQADFGLGLSSSTVYVDTITNGGNVSLAFPDTFDSFRDGTNGTKDIWSKHSYPGSPDIVALNGKLSIQSISHSNYVNWVTSNLLNNYAGGTTFYLEISSIPRVNGNPEFQISLSNITSDTAQGMSDFLVFIFGNNQNGKTYLASVYKRYGAGSIDVLYDNSIAASTISVPCSINIFISTSNYIVTGNGQILLSSTHALTNAPCYASIIYDHNSSAGADDRGTATFDYFGVAPETGTFTTQAFPVGSLITGWGPSTISDVKTGSGTITYEFGSTGTANTSLITNWASIANSGVPSPATNAYAAYRATMKQFIASDTVKLGELLTTWNEGTVPVLVSNNYDRRYWLSMTTTTSSSPQLDTILVYQRNRTWTLFKGINAASLAIWRDKLHFGDSASSGNVYQFDVGNNDNGSDINSYITFKSYDMSTLTQDKDFRLAHLSFFGNYGFSGTFGLGYAVDQTTTTYSLGTATMNDGTGQVLEKFNFKLDGTAPIQGREIQYTLTKSGTGDRLKLFDIMTNYSLKEER